MTQIPVLEVGRWADGFVVRVVGRGTLRESPTFKEFVVQCLQHRGKTVLVDLSQCDYLDSTFLGCLIGLQKQTAADRSRFVIVADSATRLRLFSTTLLDHVLSSISDCTIPEGMFQPLDIRDLDKCELGTHVAQAHRCLASTGCEDSEAFRSIAESLEEELDEFKRRDQ